MSFKGASPRVMLEGGRNPVGVESGCGPLSQGGSCPATLGSRSESRWDSRAMLRRQNPCKVQPSAPHRSVSGRALVWLVLLLLK